MWTFQKLKKLNVATRVSVKMFACGNSIVVTTALTLLESAVIIPGVESKFQTVF